jgi:hypothetical protein
MKRSNVPHFTLKNNVLNATKRIQSSMPNYFFGQITVTLILSPFEGRMRKNEDK